MFATVLWAAFVASLVGATVGLVWSFRERRSPGLGLSFASTLVLLGFSFAAGFSIGRFTVAIPVFVIGAMLAAGRGWPAVVLWLGLAAATYVLCSWLLTPLMVEGWLPAWLFGAWGIPLYSLLALAGLGASLLLPPAPGRPHRPAEHPSLDSSGHPS